jgi:ComF family protein
MKHYFWQLYAFILDLIAPPYCAYCRAFLSERTVFCVSCTELIKPLPSTTLSITSSHEMTVFALSSYQEPLKSLILSKTWSDYAASKQLAELIWHHSALQTLHFDFLIPVPLHWTRKAQRGYNQAAVIAHELSLLSGKPVAHCVKRTKRTRFQALLSALARKQNVADAFVLKAKDKALYENATMVLVDDLMTTGSTLQALGKTVTQLKPKKLYAVVACRVATV